MSAVRPRVSGLRVRSTLEQPTGSETASDRLAKAAETLASCLAPRWGIIRLRKGRTAVHCGGNPKQRPEAIFQIEDAELADGATPVTAMTLTAILGKVASRVEVDTDARFILEVVPSGAPMQVFDVNALQIREEAPFRFTDSPALYKPRKAVLNRP